MDFHIYHHIVPDSSATAVLAALALVRQQLDRMEARMATAQEELVALSAQAAQNEDIEKSALVVINSIAARIDAAGVDPTKLADLSAGLKATADALAAGIAAVPPAPAAVPPAAA